MLLTPGGPVLGSDVSGYANFEALPAALQSRVALASAPVFVSLAAYCLIALRLLRRYRGAIRPQFSALEFINLDWLRALVWFCLLIAAGSLSSELYRGITGAVTGPRPAATGTMPVVSARRRPGAMPASRRDAATGSLTAPGSAVLSHGW